AGRSTDSRLPRPRDAPASSPSQPATAARPTRGPRPRPNAAKPAAETPPTLTHRARHFARPLFAAIGSAFVVTLHLLDTKEVLVKVLFINNDGGGFADYVEVPEGTNVSSFFDKQLPGREPADFLIRVNRQHAAADQVLRDADRVSCTPVKLGG